MSGARVPIGARLVAAGLISQPEVAAALGAQASRGGRLGSLLVERFGIDVDVLAQLLAQQLAVNAALTKHFERAGATALDRIPRKVAELYGVIPLGFSLKQANTLIVAMVDPHDLSALETLRFTCRARVQPSVAAEVEIARRLRALYGTAPGWHLSAARGRGRAASALATTTLRQGNAPLTVHPEALAELEIESLHKSPSLPPVSTRERSPEARPAPQESPASTPRRVIAPPALEVEPTPNSSRATLAMPTEPPEAPPPILPSERAISLDELHMPSQMPAAEVPAGFASEPAISLDDLRMPSELPPEASLRRRSVRIAVGASRRLARSERPRPSSGGHVLEGALKALTKVTQRTDLDHTLAEYLRSALGVGLVFNVRGDAAHEWRGAAASLADDASEALVVPLDVPSLLHSAYGERAVMFGAPLRAGAGVQDALSRRLGCVPPTEALAAPIVLGQRVVKLLYAHRADGGPLDDAAIEEVARLCEAASAALVRTMLKRPS